jgi:hypothetical protein
VATQAFRRKPVRPNDRPCAPGSGLHRVATWRVSLGPGQAAAGLSEYRLTAATWSSRTPEHTGHSVKHDEGSSPIPATQGTLLFGHIRNGGLFSNQWLEHRLEREPDWV